MNISFLLHQLSERLHDAKKRSKENNNRLKSAVYTLHGYFIIYV